MQNWMEGEKAEETRKMKMTLYKTGKELDRESIPDISYFLLISVS